jgi:TolA-binding protein
MDPLTVANTLAGLLATANALFDTVRDLKKSKVDPITAAAIAKVEGQVNDFQETILRLRGLVLEQQDRIAQLQAENAQLRAENTTLSRAAAARQGVEDQRKMYTEKRVGRATVLVREGSEDSYYCPSCFETKDKAIPLQGSTGGMRRLYSYRCPGCRATF